MKKLYLIILFLSFQNIYPSSPLEKKGEKEQAEQVLPFATHVLLVFLDDSETDFGPVSYDAVPALYQKVAPILISTHLLKTIIGQGTLAQLAEKYTRYGKLIDEYYSSAYPPLSEEADSSPMQAAIINPLEEYQAFREEYVGKKYGEIKDYYDKVLQKIRDFKHGGVLSTKEKEEFIRGLKKELPEMSFGFDARTAILRSVLAFNPDDWIIRVVPSTSDSLLLLIPRSYKPKFSQIQERAKELTAQELQLGIKIDHMKALSSQELFELLQKAQKKENQDYFFSGLDSVFVSNAEYKNAMMVDKAPRWAFYLVGHGLLGKKIAGMTPEKFGRVLDFLNAKIITKLLFYWSCYAAGTNADLIYKENDRGVIRNKYFSFPIIMGLAPDTVLYDKGGESFVALDSLSVEDINFTAKSLVPKLHVNFENFVLQLTTEDVIDYSKLFNGLFPVTRVVTDISVEAFLLRTMTQVKLPGLEIFKIIDGENIVASIGQKLALSRDPKHPLYLSHFFKRQAKAKQHCLLLYARNIPFEIVLDIEPLPLIDSMIPGDVFHIIEKVTLLKSATLNELLKKFEQPPFEHPRKIFMIKQLSTTVLLPASRENIAALDRKYSDLNATMYEIAAKIMTKEDEERIKALQKEMLALDEQIKRIEQQGTSLPVAISNLVIDIKSAKMPNVFYTRNNIPYKISLIAGKIVEMPVADYLKEYQGLADNDKALQMEIEDQKRFAELSRLYGKKAHEIEAKKKTGKTK